MLVKFLKAKRGGGIGAVNYCLNERKANGTARLLKGDEALTRAIIATMPYKQKTTFCVLSFSEQADLISEATKQAIIADFEKYLLCGMENRVNTLWIEHSDKDGRLELNCIIPKIDIVSGKSFNPYMAKFDQTRINSWQEVTNFQYGFSDPKDPKRERAVQVFSKGKNYLQDYKNAIELNNFFIEQVANGNINSKAQILQMLKDADFQIKRDGVRGGTPYLSLETKDKIKIVLKGDIYSNEFTTREFIQVEKIEQRELQRSRKRSDRSNIERIEAEKRRLQRLYERRKEVNQGR
ncbi:mobilization protein, partial [Campylobacter sp. JMF_01 NE2]|nr:mobilization protein [Campylobacter sp. JMF_01 NE2]